MKIIFQVQTKSYWLLGLDDKSNRDFERVHSPPFKMNALSETAKPLRPKED